MREKVSWVTFGNAQFEISAILFATESTAFCTSDGGEDRGQAQTGSEENILAQKFKRVVWPKFGIPFSFSGLQSQDCHDDRPSPREV